LKSFVVGSCRVKKGRKISYLDLYNMFTPASLPEAPQEQEPDVAV
jgi:hypothetical protein